MKAYLALTFHSEQGTRPLLKEWRLREGREIQAGDPLFVYGEGSHAKIFEAKATGVFKAFLWKEGESLEPGCMIGVMEVNEADAKQGENEGWGCILTPEEAKGGMTYAEAASIRLPPSES
ncbi:MAG: hypothetical protein R3257_02840 [bacterium]|nr:hypothetical protein [bacterium]